ncbi:hypothetical protein ACFLZ0_02255 [Patescibacteria group bacterium]
MGFKKLVWYGLLIWMIMFTVVSAFLHSYNEKTWVKLFVLLFAGILALILAGKSEPNSITIALGYGLGWVIIGLMMDALVTLKYNPNIFQSKWMWAGYVLILLAPLLRIQKDFE